MAISSFFPSPFASSPLTSNLLPLFSNTMIGALPTLLGKMVAQAGTIHWVAVKRLSTSGRSWYNICICSRTRGSSTSVVWKYSHITCLVISSLVGPNPPVVSTMSARENASSMAVRICCRSSCTEVIWWRAMPTSLRRSAIHAELVSTTCPMSNSSPIVMISAFIIPAFTLYTLHLTLYINALVSSTPQLRDIVRHTTPVQSGG